MKICISAVCFLLLSMHCAVESGLVKDFFGKVKETAEVIHKDVKDIWRPSADNKTNTDHGEQTLTTPVAPSVAKESNDNKEEDKKTDEKTKDSKLPETIPHESLKKSDGPSTATPTKTAEGDKEDKHETTTLPSSTTTVKDERANFSGACQTNYKRTPDGRCMQIA